LVFSTYQSSPQLAGGYRKKNNPPAFDLVTCDEAHRCAGPVTSAFAIGQWYDAGFGQWHGQPLLVGHVAERRPGRLASARSGVAFTITFTDVGSGGKNASDTMGVNIQYTPATPQPSTLPNSAPQPVKGGDVKVMMLPA